MNALTNRIKQPAKCCTNCGKIYSKKQNYEKHVLLCDLLHDNKSKVAKQEEEEEIMMPTPKKMFQMLVELTKKCNRLEKQLEDVSKFVAKKKKKINFIDWLNLNIVPNILYEKIIEHIIIIEDDVVSLLENNFIDVLNIILERNSFYNLYDSKFVDSSLNTNNINNTNNTNNINNTNTKKIFPMFAFTQKSNVFYVYQNETKWSEMSRELMIKFLNKIHLKLFQAFKAWLKTKASEIKKNEGFAIKCEKTNIKLLGIEFTQDITLSKTKVQLFQKMKQDVKTILDYDFE